MSTPIPGRTYKNQVAATFEEAGWKLTEHEHGCKRLTKDYQDPLGGGIMAITDDGGLDYPLTWNEPAILSILDQDGSDTGLKITGTATCLYWFVTAILGGKPWAK